MSPGYLKGYNDVVVITNTDDPLPKDRFGSAYWSKQFGYLRMECRDGNSWNLKEFIRDGSNILPARIELVGTR